MRGKAYLFCWAVITSCAMQAATPVVSNVRASQIPDTKQVDIYYDVFDADGDAMTVSVLITDRDVGVPASSFTGAVGANIFSGSNKHIVWDAGADWNGQFSETIRVGIAASDDGANPPPAGMVRIPAGVNSGNDPDFGGYHLVLPSDLFMDRTEVTYAQWGVVRGWGNAHGYDIGAGGAGGQNNPVSTGTWYDAVKWCNARSEMEGKTPVYTVNGQIYRKGGSVPIVNASAGGYRLPTLQEWEYAARGGLRDKRYPWGDTISASDARYKSSPEINSSAPVGSYAPNGYGLYDMAGNVREWCWDTMGSGKATPGGTYSYDGSVSRIKSPGWSYIDQCYGITGLRTVCR